MGNAQTWKGSDGGVLDSAMWNPQIKRNRANGNTGTLNSAFKNTLPTDANAKHLKIRESDD